jgi:hypothetical protein
MEGFDLYITLYVRLPDHPEGIASSEDLEDLFRTTNHHITVGIFPEADVSDPAYHNFYILANS